MALTMRRPRFTIERIRTLVLIGGVLLVAAIAVFLAAGQWKRHFLSKDLPKRLGIDIQQQADGVNYTQSRKGKTLFRIHAARAVQLKKSGQTLLKDVKIDLYGEDGTRSDTIAGSEFEYDPAAGVATAAGEVEITLMRPGVKPAIAQLTPQLNELNELHAQLKAGADISGSAKTSAAKIEALKGDSKTETRKSAPLNPLAAQVVNEVVDDQIHVKTSGLTFNQKSGIATTSERVQFALRQGSGNSIGATYDSGKGQLILDHAVELHVDANRLRGSGASAANGPSSGPMTVLASHAEFERGSQQCTMTAAQADYSGGTAHIANAVLHFRDDGSVTRLDGANGVDLQTAAGSHLTAPRGTLDFDDANHPHHGLLEGGARLQIDKPNRRMEGTAPTAELAFDAAGQLRSAHLQSGVSFTSQQQNVTAKGVVEQVHRTWNSRIADIDFASAPAAKGHAAGTQGRQPDSHLEPRTIRGQGGVVITSETRTGVTVEPSKLTADAVVGQFSAAGALSSLSGSGHANFEQRTARGVHQASSSDQLEIRFEPVASTAQARGAKTQSTGSGIASILQTGNVILTQDEPQDSHAAAHVGQSGTPTAIQPAAIQATANRAEYEGGSQMLHLSGSPRIRDGALDMTANRIDFARDTGNAFAHGDVRASWMRTAGQAPPPGLALLADGGGGNDGKPGSSGPIHAIAAEAELHQATQEIIFRSASKGSPAGTLPRLWQSANSISAPVLILNRQKQTLTAEADGAANPVRTILVSGRAIASDKTAGATGAERQAGRAFRDPPAQRRPALLRSGTHRAPRPRLRRQRDRGDDGQGRRIHCERPTMPRCGCCLRA